MIYKEIAGYALDSVFELSKNNTNDFSYEEALKFLSYFEIETTETLSNESISNISAIISNLISRGTPTKPSIYLENSFKNSIGWTECQVNRKIGNINFKLKNIIHDRIELILKSLVIIDPRLKPYTNPSDRFKGTITSWETHPDPTAEEKFLYSKLPEIVGDQYIIQSLEPQRDIESILKYGKSKKENLERRHPDIIDQFYSQRIDFTFQFPGAKNGLKDSMTIEIDGYQHDNPLQKNLDSLRDEAIRDIGWNSTQRIKTTALNHIPATITSTINNFLNHPFAKLLKSNYNKPLYSLEEGLDALQMALSPLSIARIQKLIIRLIDSGHLNLSQDQWNIAVIERDVPCFHLALEDLNNQIQNLSILSGSFFKIPFINLKIFNTDEFRNCKLSKNYEYLKYTENIQINDFKADILIDISILQKRNFTKPSEQFISNLGNPKTFIIRSSYSPNTDRIVQFQQPLNCISLISDTNHNKNIIPLKYFLRNIFRKIGFRDGQVKILDRALQRKNVIALLPTGAGKSLTYQLASLLQPGITIVIDPIKSLMKDQYDNLKKIGIDNTEYVNSSLKAHERVDRIERMTKGHYQFIFISPERLQIEEFRNALLNMAEKQKWFSYCVIDEAHCVSEWGHDFRTAYLKLGENSRKYCKTADKNDIPILGLTGTASFDVLSDVRRELNLDDDPNSIIRPSSSERKELSFHIVKADNALANNNFWDNYNNYASAKLEALITSLIQFPQLYNSSVENFFSIDGENTNAGIIFCPHVKGNYGVINIKAKLSEVISQLQNISGVYAGQLNDDDNIDLEDIQDKFVNNQYSLLVATKAFGMGIDKPNIRYTFHLNMPPSIEAFYQEAGRAGRDKTNSHCYILYTGLILDNNQTIDFHLNHTFWQNSFIGEEREKYKIHELLNQISYPIHHTIEDINKYILEAGYNAKLKNYIVDHAQILYINGLEFGQTYGSYNYSNGNIVVKPENLNIDYSKCEAFINEILNFLKENTPENKTLKEWLTQESHPDPSDGIEKALAEMNYDSPPQIIIVEFENDKIKFISDILLQYNNQLTDQRVKRILFYASDFESFLDQLGIDNIEGTHQTKLKKYFNIARIENDTFKAVYRLSVIGVIDSYNVNYNTKSISLSITKKDDQFYIERLQNYISRYVSHQISTKVPKDVLEYRGNSVIQKCLGYLIDFTYSNIASKRKKAIEVMEEACKIGIERGDDEFKSYVNTYFDSKYYIPLSDYIYEYDISVLFEFLKTTDGVKDELLHLRGACDRLAIENPDNGLYKILRSSANLLLYTDHNFSDVFDLRNGWEEIVSYLNFNQKEFTSNFSMYYNIMCKYNNNLISILNIEILQIHLRWIKNQKQYK